jgi:O-antigen/teichoic acid export membrane protein
MGRPILTASMPSGSFRRRAVTALALYSGSGLGILATIVAARLLGLEGFGLFATVMAAAGVLQTLLDLTVEESLTKYGFRYVAAEDWGRLRQLFRRALQIKLVGGALAALALVGLAFLAEAVFGSSDLAWPMAAAAAIPLAQAPENVASTALLLRRRYDVRALFGALSMALRLAAILVAASAGVLETVLAIGAAQVIATAAISVAGLRALRSFEAAPRSPLADDRPEIVSFVLRSSAATGIVAARTTLAPLLLGVVSGATQVGLFRVAQAPQTGFFALSSPIRLVQLTEQTELWERGHQTVVLARIRRYTLQAAGVMVLAVPVFLLLMPWLVRVVFGSEYEAAVDPARIVLCAAALQFVAAWTKTLPVTIGRPGLRIVTHGVEAAVLLVLVVVLGARWDVTGAAVAVLVSTVIFVCLWAVIVIRLHAAVRARQPPATRRSALVP